jgi:hypothetical protein
MSDWWREEDELVTGRACHASSTGTTLFGSPPGSMTTANPMVMHAIAHGIAECIPEESAVVCLYAYHAESLAVMAIAASHETTPRHVP